MASNPTKPPKSTSWQKVAGWYDRLLEGEGTYQKDLILPNLLRILAAKPGEHVLDLACGQGFFAHHFAKTGVEVTGVDASRALIDRANKVKAEGKLRFRVGPAHKLNFLQDGSVDKGMIVLAIQNIENPGEVFAECGRVLRPAGTLALVLNHPAFRIPKASEWGWDEAKKVQYRRVDRYLSEMKAEIEMHPGRKGSAKTLSFHRPLQFYVKALRKAGFSLVGLEEWNSHRESQPGPRAEAENLARKEIPLFMCLLARKDSQPKR